MSSSIRSVPSIVDRVRPGKDRSMQAGVAWLADPRNDRCYIRISGSVAVPRRARKPLHDEPPMPCGSSRRISRRLISGMCRANVSGKVFVALQHKVPRDLLRRLILGWFTWPKHPAALRTTQKPRLFLPDEFARHGLVYAGDPTRCKQAFRSFRRAVSARIHLRA